MERVEHTLRLFSDWGYAATVGSLSKNLLGGAVSPLYLFPRLETMEGVELHGEIVSLGDGHDLVAETARRTENHTSLEPRYMKVARSFTRDLIQSCPFVQCVAVAGSLGSGGFDEGDDIDFDLFVEDDTKYITYLLAVLLGIRYAWRYRHRQVGALHRTPLLPKITCVNVVWTESDTRPFVRTDVDLAFELLRCRPIYGVRRFWEVLRDNLWLRGYFPQLYQGSKPAEVQSAPNRLGRLIRSLRAFPRVHRTLEWMSKGLAWLLYRYVQWTRRRNPEAVKRMEFLRHVKYPYEVFQD